MLLALASLACGGSSPGRRTPQPGQVVFDCYRVNFAWGYTLSGSYVDREGRIFRYARRKDPWLPKSVGKGNAALPARDLLDKFQNAEPVARVEMDVLEQKLALVEAASQGRITREQQRYDSGSFTCSAYLYDPGEDSYREVVLGADGDFRVRNSAPEARSLHEWLVALLSHFAGG